MATKKTSSGGEKHLAAELFDSAKTEIRTFLSSGAVDAAAASAFGVSAAELAAAVESLDLKGWPRLVVLDEQVLQGARAAYDATRDTIYLSRAFVNDSAPAAVTAVLTEEIGHAIDARLHKTDAAGDEGAIFAQFVAGSPPSAADFAALQAKNDHGSIVHRGKTLAVEFAAPAAGSITLDGSLADWTSADQIDRSLSVSGYDIYAKQSGGYYVFALKAPVAVGASSTAWLNTDQNAATGYQIWGFAGGAEYNVDFDSTGTPRLYTGADGQTLVSGATVLHGYSADRTVVEFAVASSAIGSPTAINTLWDINNNTFLPTDFSAAQYTVGATVAPPPPQTIGSITLDGNLADWTTADQIDGMLSASGYDIYAKSTNGYYVFALKAPVAIGGTTTAWLNTDQNATTGYKIWGFAGGAEYNVNFDAAGTPRLYMGADGQTLVSSAVPFAYSADRTAVEFAVASNAIGSPTAINTLWDINNNTFLPTDYSATQYTVTGPATPANRAPTITSNGGGDAATSSVAENSTAITTVTASDPDAGQTLTYSIIGGADQALLQISSAGVLTFRTARDFDAPADSDRNNSYVVQVRAADNGSPSLADTQTITVNLGDVNDNAPVITTAATLSLVENTTNVAALTSTDVDTVGTKPATFSIAGGADAARFAISGGNLVFTSAPDFENPTDSDRNNSYVVQVSASDGANVTNKTITVNVTDVVEAVNRPPVITSNGGADSATIVVNENTTAVATVTANDPAAGQTLSYSIAGGADQALFQVSSTGGLTFRTPRDFEAPADADRSNSYVVQVRVADNGSPSSSDTQTITVTVRDVNDNAPVITTAATLSLAENTTTVSALTSTDVDTVGTKPATFSIAGGADAARFAISGGSLVFTSAADFENPTDSDRNNSYVVQVSASDGANVTNKTITVNVTDVADMTNRPPVVTSNDGGDTAAISRAEDSIAVTTVTASDPDAGQTITYVITGGADAALFAIDAGTGALTFKSAPDFESPADHGANNVYNVTVGARDSSGGLDTQALAITVTNVDGVTLIGDANANTLTGTPEPDTLDGNGGDDMLYGLGGNDVLYAGAGNNLLDGGPGADHLQGGPANDVFIWDPADTWIAGGGGIDTLRITGAFVTLDLTQAVSRNAIDGIGIIDLTGSGNNAAVVSVNDVYTMCWDNVLRFDGNAGDAVTVLDTPAWTVAGNRVIGANTYRVWTQSGAELLIDTDIAINREIGVSRTGDVGNNILNGTDADDALSGLAGNDTLNGWGGNDVLQGGDGNDTLDGGAGVDTMIGGPGNDTYGVDNPGDVVTEAAGEGVDHVQASISYTLGATLENLTLTGSAQINGSGNADTNVLVGNGAANTLDGGAGNDTIDGGGGNDLVIGGAGADRLTGGSGSDRFQYQVLGDGVDTIVDFTHGSSETDQIDVSRLLTGYTPGTSNIDNFIRLSGTTATTVSVNADGIGTDFVAVATLANVPMRATLLSELITQGSLVLSSSATGATAVGNVVSLTGNAFIDGLTQGSSWVFAGTGPRVITYSLSLNDTPNPTSWTSAFGLNVYEALLQWSSVANVAFVERGSGTAFTSSTADIAITLATNELQPAGIAALSVFPDPAFADTFISAAEYTRAQYPRPEGDIFLDDASPAFSYSLNGSLGRKVLLHEIGHALGLKHTYDDGANGRPTFAQLGIASYDNPRHTLMSATPAGADPSSGHPATPMLLDILAIQRIYGANTSYNTGDNTYYWYQSMQTIWDAGGNDTIDSPGALGAASIDLRAGALSTAGDAVISIAYGVTIENARGGFFNDIMIGNDADNGLDGREGADRIEGGRGNDVYSVDNAGDVVIERAGEGRDTVFSTISYTLPQNVEVLLLTQGTNGTGNDLDNEIYGNSFAANVLVGNGGNDLLDGQGGGNWSGDTLRGGPGNDIYIVRSAKDSVIELAGEGIDAVRMWGELGTSYTLPANVENLEVLSGPLFTGIGNALDNVMTGSVGPETLDGGAGNDVLVGGFDNDTLTGGSGSDRFDYNSYWDGLDTITDFTRGAGGDRLDIKDVLVSYTPGVSNIDNFVRLSGTTSTTLSVNVDGAGTDFFALATLTTIAMTPTLLSEMLAQGNLIV